MRVPNSKADIRIFQHQQTARPHGYSGLICASTPHRLAEHDGGLRCILVWSRIKCGTVQEDKHHLQPHRPGRITQSVRRSGANFVIFQHDPGSGTGMPRETLLRAAVDPVWR